MTDRFTKQGVRNLDPAGRNGHRSHGASCRHWFAGPFVVIGQRWVVDELGDPYQEEIYGQRCSWCSEVKEFR